MIAHPVEPRQSTIWAGIPACDPDPDPDSTRRSWAADSGRLSRWAWSNLVNRVDVYGGYWRHHPRSEVRLTTRGVAHPASHPAGPLTRERIRWHFDPAGIRPDPIEC